MATVSVDIKTRAYRISGNDVYGIHVVQELIRQHGPAAASEIFDMLEARGLKGGDLFFVYNKVREVESPSTAGTSADDIGRKETWKAVLENPDSWAGELQKFRGWHTHSLNTADA